MSKRLTSDTAKTVSLFPFLAVLLCTMGALLVLLVVLAQRAGERIILEAQGEAAASSTRVVAAQVPSKDAAAAQQLAIELEQVRAYQKVLADLRLQAEQRLLDEKNRLSHLEQHTRDLEEELARRFLASEQLKATEKNRSVDQQQAERELARLQKLIEDTEAQLEVLREEQNGKKSYAIVPYRGPNGTYRKPIYIECRNDGIIIHPEGIRLQASDFRVPTWAGNPLAAALRATRGHVTEAAAKAGNPIPPDPYPVILVRPDGIPQYSVARAAITSWDASFGYEFIDGDWDLEFPEGPDPALAREQEHAIMLARDRLARLIRSAPSRFQGVRFGGRGSAEGGAASGSGGDGIGSGSGDADFGLAYGEAEQGGPAIGNGFAGNPSASSPNAAADTGKMGGEVQVGAFTGDGGGGSTNGESGEGLSAGRSERGESGEANGGGAGERYADASGVDGGGTGSSSQTSGSSQASASPGGPSSSSGSSGSSGSGAASSGRAQAGGSAQMSSIADAKGRNWAVKKGGAGSVPIRRPIQIVVRKDRLAMLPNRHALDRASATGKVISLNQPMAQISEEFAVALRARVKEWGLAGSGLYWRPVLKLNVGPGAEQTANQIMRLLQDSGVEISQPETARASQGGTNSATR